MAQPTRLCRGRPRQGLLWSRWPWKRFNGSFRLPRGCLGRRWRLAEAIYRAAAARWPAARITLRQGMRVVHDTVRRLHCPN
jgi:hypothetical protein